MLRSTLRSLRRALSSRPAARRSEKRPQVEALEDRRLLAANLWVTDAYLTDTAGNKIDKAAVGQLVMVQTEFKTQDLAPGANYKIRFSIDGDAKSTDTLTWGAGQGVKSWVARWGDWVVKSGNHTVTVELDATNTVSETSGADNDKSFNFAPVTFSSSYGDSKFVTPLAGTPFVHWTIVNYCDLDRREDIKIDYNGGGRTYDGHDALDISLTGFQTDNRFIGMDYGLPAIAAADGVVVDVHDGEFDRNTQWQGAGPANYVKIDHGNGWTTSYLHLRKNSVAVQVGDFVKGGTKIGLVGSSGRSTDPHLHFSVYHDGDMVETYVAPNSYWVSPLPYAPTQDGTPMQHWDKTTITENGGSVLVKLFNPFFALGGTFKYATENITAVAGSDYTAKSGNITFAPFEISKTVSVAITDDVRHEGSEKFRVRLSTLANVSLSTEEVTILDNDALLSYSAATKELTFTGDTDAANETIKVDVIGSNLVLTVGIEATSFPKAKVDSLVIKASGGDDTIYVFGTAAGIITTVDGRGGNDTIHVGRPGELFDAEFSLDDIDGELNLVGGVGTDTAYLKDNASLGPAGFYTLTGNAVFRSGSAKITYTGVETTEIDEGQGNDLFFLGSTAPAAGLKISAGSGSDTIYGFNVATTFTVDGANKGSVSYGGVKFEEVENLVGGSAADTFVMKPLGSVSGKIDGNGGVDLLDYGARGTGVTVNLSTNSATSIGGQVLGIEDVKGGSGNDILTGNNLDNLLDGGTGIDNLAGLAGNDILLGGAGNDVLDGGDGRDLLFGGLGADIMVGGKEEDILVGGTATFDTKWDVLKASRTVWTGPETNAQRIDKLRNTGVTVSAITYKWNFASMLDDATTDNILGGDALDWFWASKVGPTKDTLDALATETVN